MKDIIKKKENKEKIARRLQTSYYNKISMGQRRKVIKMWFGEVGNKDKLVNELTKVGQSRW